MSHSLASSIPRYLIVLTKVDTNLGSSQDLLHSYKHLILTNCYPVKICHPVVPTNTIGTRPFPFAPTKRVVGPCVGPGRLRTCYDSPLWRLQRGREDIS